VAPFAPSSEASNGYSKEPEAFKASVLVIDDEPSFCFAISEILTLEGYQVRQAHTARQAFDILEEITPDLILTDVMMPGVDGLTFLRRLRRHPDLEAVPTIAISAMAMKSDIQAAKDAGADHYLPKPFSAKELRQAIALYLNGNSDH
jgi:CheY-like chemotaxis protein